MTENLPTYFKVHVSFLQEQELLVAAESVEACEKLVTENVLPTTEQFKIISINPLTDEEKAEIMQAMTGFDPETKRTLN